MDNPSEISGSPASAPFYGSLVNSRPPSRVDWVAVAIVVVIAIAAVVFLFWPVAFLFMELK